MKKNEILDKNFGDIWQICDILIQFK